MRTVLRAAATLAVTAGLALQGPAHPAEVCVENNQLTFTPPLTTDNVVGTVRLDYQVTCADTPATAALHYAGTATYNYFGSCALAILTEPGVSVLVAGTGYVQATPGNAKVLVTRSTADRCPITTVRGTGFRVKAP